MFMLLWVSAGYTNTAMLPLKLDVTSGCDGVGTGAVSLRGSNLMKQPDDVSGSAALAICESLLLALNDHNILPEHEIVGVLKDASAAQEPVPGNDDMTALNAAVRELIDKIIAGGNSVRRG